MDYMGTPKLRTYTLLVSVLVSMLMGCATTSHKETADYATSIEAFDDVAEAIRNPDAISLSAHGFRFNYYDDWAFEPDVVLTLSPIRGSTSFTGSYMEYHGQLQLAVSDLYDQGIQTRAGILHGLKRTAYEASSDGCKDLQVYYQRLYELFKQDLVSFDDEPAPNRIILDSPSIYHYYFVNSSYQAVNLDVMEKKDALYDETQAAIAYIKQCGKKTDY